MPRRRKLVPLPALLVLLWLAAMLPSARGVILWSDAGPILAHENDQGTDILHGVVRRDDTASDTLYFKFHVNPLSDVSKEEYSAGFQLFQNDTDKLGVGNSLKAWAYSAFDTDETGKLNQVPGDMDLFSASPETYEPDRFTSYELPRRGIERTIVFKVQFVPGGHDLVTVWMNPNLKPGATENNQLTNLVTHFRADATFNQIRLRHHGNGEGWEFNDMAVATSFDDFIITHFWQQLWFIGLMVFMLVIGVAATVRVVERRKYQMQLRHAEQERALERERARIAQDLHDDLGSSLTRLSLLSGLIKADKDNPAQVEAHAGKLSESADHTVRALEEIVWAVRPGSDTLQSLVDYIAHFANELFDGNATRCRLDMPHDVPARALPPDVRHNIFLIVKEALTNTLKHAGAREVQLQMRIAGNVMEILVQDDGKGFDRAGLPKPSTRNGLVNMRRRAETIGGILSVESSPAKGTSVRLNLKFPN